MNMVSLQKQMRCIISPQVRYMSHSGPRISCSKPSHAVNIVIAISVVHEHSYGLGCKSPSLLQKDPNVMGEIS